MAKPLRIVLFADEKRLIRDSLEALLTREGFQVSHEGRPGADLSTSIARIRPDVAILDLPPGIGIAACLSIRESSPTTKCLLVTDSARERDAVEALRAGIRGYVLKSRPAEELVSAIREVAAGGIAASPEVSQLVTDACEARRPGAPRDPLTPRAEEVLRLLADGKTTKEIARALGLSVKTAESHRTRLMERLAIHHTAGLVRYAIRRGLIEA